MPPAARSLIARCAATLLVVWPAVAAPPSGVPGHGWRRSGLAPGRPVDTHLPSHAERANLDFLPPPITELGPIDEVGLMLEDDLEPQPAPFRFGVQRVVPLTLADGQWVRVSGGTIWRCDVEGVGSTSSRLHLSGLRLEEGQEIFLSAPAEPSAGVGPITGRGERDDGEAWGNFARGGAARLEWFVPDGTAAGRLPFDRVEYAHAYRDVFMEMERQALVECRNQPSCFAGWADQSNATARVMFTRNNINVMCSGQLMATMLADETPYLSTAYHCIKTSTEAASANMRFFYRTAECDGAMDANVSVPGANLVATHQASDISLLMVRGALPPGVYWSGWMTGAPPVGTASVCLHHPNGYPQAISFGAKTGTSGACSNTPTTFTVNWTVGVTEPGSSGGGLYDEASHMLYGLLSCGTSGCNYAAGWDGFSRWDLALANGGFAAFMVAGSDDAFEPDDTCATAAALMPGTYANLVAKRLGPDWYAIEVPQGARLNVSSTYLHANGDLDFRLWGACSDTGPIAEEVSDVNNESFSYVNQSGSTTLLLEVFLASGTRNTYGLGISISAACAEDLDGDQEVTGGDLGMMLLDFGPCPGCPADLDGDGAVTAADIALMLLAFGPCP